MSMDNNKNNFVDYMNNNQMNNQNYDNVNTKMINLNNNINNNNNAINMSSLNNINNENNGNTLIQLNKIDDNNFQLYYSENNNQNNNDNKQTLQLLKDKLPNVITSIENEPKIIQEGKFDKVQIYKIKKIINSYKVKVETISQKLKEEFGGDWFVLSYKQDQGSKLEDFDFKFTNNKIEDVFIFSENKCKYFICKL